MTEPSIDDVRKLLGAHGHGFQHAVLRMAESLTSRQSPWVFEAAEYPVGDAVAPMHIDFVLRARRSHVYLVAECKRADPARANWCFIKTPYTWRNASGNELAFQEVRSDSTGLPAATILEKNASIEASHLGFEMRTGEKGEGLVSGSAIKDATAQVLRGMNGFINDLFLTRKLVLRDPDTALFIPAIFTTATLFLAEGDLGEADIATGRLPSQWGNLKKVEWLWYTYNQSPALTHRIPSDSAAEALDLSRNIRAEYSRTIAMVSPSGIEKFLGPQLFHWL